jgi:hypothetical protein
MFRPIQDKESLANPWARKRSGSAVANHRALLASG